MKRWKKRKIGCMSICFKRTLFLDDLYEMYILILFHTNPYKLGHLEV